METYRMPLFLPSQGAAESEATIVEWKVAEGDAFQKEQLLAVVDSAKAIYDFVAPCDGVVTKVFHAAGDVVPYTEPVLEIETNDPDMKKWVPDNYTPAP